MATEEAIILVGGRGTRLATVVSDVPKPLAPVAGRPFLAWLLDELAATGMRRVVLASGHLAAMVETAVGTRWQGMQVDYSVEVAPLGTGGAIRLAASRLRGDNVHIVNGDTYLRYDPGALERLTLDEGAGIGLALAHVHDVARYGAVELEGARVVALREKGGQGPGLVNAGCYFLTARAIAALPARVPASFETECLGPAADRGDVVALTQTTGFIDIGVPDDYARAQSLFGGSR